jgi:hypothetical protein
VSAAVTGHPLVPANLQSPAELGPLLFRWVPFGTQALAPVQERWLCVGSGTLRPLASPCADEPHPVREALTIFFFFCGAETEKSSFTTKLPTLLCWCFISDMAFPILIWDSRFCS